MHDPQSEVHISCVSSEGWLAVRMIQSWSGLRARRWGRGRGGDVIRTHLSPGVAARLVVRLENSSYSCTDR